MVINKDFTEFLKDKGLSDSFTEILDKMFREFSKAIMEDLTAFHYNPADYTAFVDLELISREFALQKFFEPRLDTYIRQYLVCGLIEEVLEERGKCVLIPSLPDEYQQINTYYSTKKYEDIVGFEFVIHDGDELVGYRFTDILEYKAEPFFENQLVNRIVVIDWANIDGIDEDEKKRRTYGKYNDRINIIGLREFIEDIFDDNEAIVYDLFLRKSIESYQETIGISSIPKLTAPVLFEHRLDEERLLLSRVKDIYMFHNEERKSVDKNGIPTKDTHFGYRIIEEKNRQEYPDLEKRSKELLINSGILEKYLNKKLYKALVGKCDFARSFLTSEYLYNQYNENDRFDYTSIVSGYLKSVEQLMYNIVLFNQDKKDSNNRYYRVGSPGKKNALTKSHVEAGKLSATMGNLIYFFKIDYPETVQISNQAYLDTFFDCLDLYLDECRNQSFHKYNNYDWNRVMKIRNNTFLMYILLLGACRLGVNDEETYLHLEILQDDRLERIYYWLRRNNMYTFKMIPKGEKAYLVTTRFPEETFPEFDDYGLLQNFQIKVRCTKEITSSFSESKYLVIDRENIPESILYTTYVSEYPIDYSI